MVEVSKYCLVPVVKASVSVTPCVTPSVVLSVPCSCTRGAPRLLALSVEPKVVSGILMVEVSKYCLVPVVKASVSVTPCVTPSVVLSVPCSCTRGAPRLLALSVEPKVVSGILMVEVSKYCLVPVVKASVSVTPCVTPSVVLSVPCSCTRGAPRLLALSVEPKVVSGILMVEVSKYCLVPVVKASVSVTPCVTPSVVLSVPCSCTRGAPRLLALSVEPKVVSGILMVEVSKYCLVPVVKASVLVTPCVTPSVVLSVPCSCTRGAPVLLDLSMSPKVVSGILMVEVSKYCLVPVVKASVSVTPCVTPSVVLSVPCSCTRG